MALLYNGGPLCDPFPIFSKHPVFGEFTLLDDELAVQFAYLGVMNLSTQPLGFSL